VSEDLASTGRGKSPETRPSLLIRIRDGQDRQAWEDFVDIYAPLIFGFARNHHMQDADAADLTQDVLTRVHRSIMRFDYDAHRGKFRSWLFTITQNALRRRCAVACREPQGTGDTAMRRLLEEIPDDAHEFDGDFWQREYRRCLFRWAAKKIQVDFHPTTWRAFWETVVEDCSPGDVAQKLDMSLGAVYTAKSRVLARLRDELEQLQREELADF
jgi:RNA polymerase sigma-70 factor (ECF subfamily)